MPRRSASERCDFPRRWQAGTMLARKQTPRRWRRPANVRLSTSAGGACAFTAIDVAGGQKGEALAVDAARRCRRADEAELPARRPGRIVTQSQRDEGRADAPREPNARDPTP